MHHCTITIDPSFESLCLEDILKMAQTALESENQEFMTHNNLQIIQNIFQSLINKNNQNAEQALVSLEPQEVGYASKEQNLLDLYRYFLLQFQNIVQKDLSLEKYQLSNYFDNYFTDFEYNLQMAMRSPSNQVTTHAYYAKMYKTTLDKMSIIYKNYLYNIKKYKENYIKNKIALSELEDEKEHYMLEFRLLLDEFLQYAQRFLRELKANKEDMQKLQDDLLTLQERFSV